MTGAQMKRQNDIYIMSVSNTHQISAKGKYVAIVSTQVETANPQQEIAPALKLLGKIDHIFCTVSRLYEPNKNKDGSQDGVWVTSSFDATSHFESASRDVMNLWRQIHGEELVLTVHPDAEG
jgi:Rab GDP dissociation inhibitor